MHQGLSASTTEGAGGPVLFYGLSDAELPRFENHETAPVLIRKGADQPVWLPPVEAEAIFSFAKAWSNAPREAPAGWPFNIRFIQLASAGVDVLPQWAWEGPVVACARGITAEPIAEYVVTAIVRDSKRFSGLICSDAAQYKHLMDERNWPQGTFRSIKGQTLGLVGYGAIGQAIARRAEALGMNVKALRRSTPQEASGLFVGSITELAAQADHLVLCAPATPETHHIVNAAVLSACKKGAHLIKVARGTLVDQHALLDALDRDDGLRHATLDVTDPEPLPDGHPFYRHPKVTLTPHAAWYSADHHDRLTAKLLANLSTWVHGEPLADRADRGKGY
jgi:phosphoglycerate dehydrogenase-like enzyme